MKFKTIVADPPWPINSFPAWFCKEKRSRKEIAIGCNPTPYKTMTLEEIKNLPVGDIADDGSHLYLWTTDNFMEAAISVARTWGFEKSATLVWCKKPMGKGIGGTFPCNVEFVLFCRRVDNRGWKDFGLWLRKRRLEKELTTGQVCEALGAHGKINHGGTQSNWENGLALPSPEQWEKLKQILGLDNEKDTFILSQPKIKRGYSRWFEFPRGRHSKKPEGFQDIVEGVSSGPFVELFARRKRPGWDVWGNEVENTIELDPMNDPCF